MPKGKIRPCKSYSIQICMEQKCGHVQSRQIMEAGERLLRSTEGKLKEKIKSRS